MTSTPDRPVDEVLDVAADALLMHGWCVGEWQDDEGRMCLEGALAQALFGDPQLARTSPHARQLAEFIHEHLPGICATSRHEIDDVCGCACGYEWNDNVVGRHDDAQDDVIEVLRRGAKTARETRDAEV